MSDPTMADHETDQPLVGYRSNEEWNDLMAQAAAMLGALDEIKDEEIRAVVFSAMAGIDAVHRRRCTVLYVFSKKAY